MGWFSMFTRPMAIGSLERACEAANKQRKRQDAILDELKTRVPPKETLGSGGGILPLAVVLIGIPAGCCLAVILGLLQW